VRTLLISSQALVPRGEGKRCPLSALSLSPERRPDKEKGGDDLNFSALLFFTGQLSLGSERRRKKEGRGSYVLLALLRPYLKKKRRGERGDP